jgi:hypothetical protein
MLMKTYINEPVTEKELQALVALSMVEERAFFDRNRHLVQYYGDRRMAVALCQGAALQFLRRGYGVNDFDVHFFYAQNPQKPRLSRAVKRVIAEVGAFRRASVDFIRTVVPGGVASGAPSAMDQLRCFLRRKPTANATHLAEKAVIGLMPRELFGETIWPAV